MKICKFKHVAVTVTLALLVTGCGEDESAAPPATTKQRSPAAPPSAQPVDTGAATEPTPAAAPEPAPSNPRFVETYKQVKLTADLNHLSARQKQLVAKLIDASKIMDDLFWQQAYGDKQSLLSRIDDPHARRFAEYNYGPWDRLDGDKPFVQGAGEKPAGAQFYPTDMSKQQLASAQLPDRGSPYHVIRRDAEGELITVPYSQAYLDELNLASVLLLEAASMAEDEGFANYLRLRADALLTDDYYASDIAWMDSKTNPIELVYGPIETYEDKLFGKKTAFEAYVLIKDQEWSQRLAKFTQFLPELQRKLPVPPEYKEETPGSDADLNAYDVVYYAGDCNAGSKTIAINLPNDERVQLEKGTRRLQLKNAMRAKFDHILQPITEQLIVEEQRQHITFDAFFANTMFHEVAHGLGIKNTINGKGTVSDALNEAASALEEGKADILGLYMIEQLHAKGELGEAELMDYYVTFMASIFRSVRFGAASAHGKANMIRFTFFKLKNAVSRDKDTGLYRVNPRQMKSAVASLARRLLQIQGDGDYAAAVTMLNEMGVIGPQLEADLARLVEAKIPVDVVFEQGKEILGI